MVEYLINNYILYIGQKVEDANPTIWSFIPVSSSTDKDFLEELKEDLLTQFDVYETAGFIHKEIINIGLN